MSTPSTSPASHIAPKAGVPRIVRWAGMLALILFFFFLIAVVHTLVGGYAFFGSLRDTIGTTSALN